MSMGHMTCFKFLPVYADGWNPVFDGFEWLAVGKFFDSEPAPP